MPRAKRPIEKPPRMPKKITAGNSNSGDVFRRGECAQSGYRNRAGVELPLSADIEETGLEAQAPPPSRR